MQKLRSVKKIQLMVCKHLIGGKKNTPICSDWLSNCTCLFRQRLHYAEPEKFDNAALYLRLLKRTVQTNPSKKELFENVSQT